MMVPGPAEERGAADHCCRDRVEHERKASLEGLDRVDAYRLEDAGERAERAAETKLPTLILRTFTPLSLAPSRLPPVATVWSPQRVRVSRIVMTAITPSAQYTVTYGEPPKKRKNVWPPGGLDREGARDVEGDAVQDEDHPKCRDERGTRRTTVISPLTSPTEGAR